MSTKFVAAIAVLTAIAGPPLHSHRGKLRRRLIRLEYRRLSEVLKAIKQSSLNTAR